MAHYSEMDFLFSSDTNRNDINRQLNNTSSDNTRNIFDSTYTVYKYGIVNGTNNIKSYLQTQLYNNETNSVNPYVKLINDFNTETGKPGAGLRLKPSDFAYLRDLGVYPINRMAILRRFDEGLFVNENLGTMTNEPISTIIGWVKPDANFSTISFNETWDKTNKRFDEKIAQILKDVTGGVDISKIIPIPGFAQGMLFELYKNMGLLDSSSQNTATDGNLNEKWGLRNIPVGDPNVLKEGPYRNPEVQNIQSSFSFELETTYEQKLIGNVDPGSAILDILDNIYAMGTSNMSFYWGDGSKIIRDVKNANDGKAHDLQEWWTLLKTIGEEFWKTLKKLFTTNVEKLKKDAAENYDTASKKDEKAQLESEAAAKTKQVKIDAFTKNSDTYLSNRNKFTKGTTNYIKWDNEYIKAQKRLSELNAEGKTTKPESINIGQKSLETKAEVEKIGLLEKVISGAMEIMSTILTSTISIHRFELRGTIELMVGGQDSSAPWHLTIGNPYSPWLNTSHIIVKTCTIETSNEMGFNDIPQRLTAKFNCEFSRSLGRQELMRMFNNTYKRTYSSPPTMPTNIKNNNTEIENKPNANNIASGTEFTVLADKKTPGTSNDDPSIVNYLNNRDNTKYTYQQRKVMATKAGIKNYTGTAEQNTQWLNSLRAQDNGSTT